MDSPVTINSSMAAAALDDLAVDRHALARPHAQAVAGDVRLIERHILVACRLAVMRRAIFGESQAVRGWRRWSARGRCSSSTCPSSTSTVMTAAASK